MRRLFISVIMIVSVMGCETSGETDEHLIEFRDNEGVLEWRSTTDEKWQAFEDAEDSKPFSPEFKHKDGDLIMWRFGDSEPWQEAMVIDFEALDAPEFRIKGMDMEYRWDEDHAWNHARTLPENGDTPSFRMKENTLEYRMGEDEAWHKAMNIEDEVDARIEFKTLDDALHYRLSESHSWQLAKATEEGSDTTVDFRINGGVVEYRMQGGEWTYAVDIDEAPQSLYGMPLKTGEDPTDVTTNQYGRYPIEINIENLGSETLTITEITRIIHYVHGNGSKETQTFEPGDTLFSRLERKELDPQDTVRYENDLSISMEVSHVDYIFTAQNQAGETLHTTSRVTMDYDDTVSAPALTESFEGLSISNEPDMIYADEGDHWYYTKVIKNTTDAPIELLSLQEYFFTFYEDYSSGHYYDQTDFSEWFGSVWLDPGESFELRGGLPASNNIHFLDFVFEARLSDGRTVQSAERIHLSQERSPAIPESHPRDTINLRYNADFALDIDDGIEWVPVNTLGTTDHDSGTLRENAGDYAWVRENINSLYEVIQYIQTVDYAPASTNQRIEEGGQHWEHHEPAQITIQNNEGNCASIANLMVFALEDVYDEVGYIAWSHPDGSGHIFNYIKHDGEYYAIDLTNYTNANMSAGTEIGLEDAYYDADYVAGNLHRVASLQRYAEYFYEEASKFGNPPVIYSAYAHHTNAAIDSIKRDGTMHITYPQGTKQTIDVLYEADDASIRYIFEGAPQNYPEEWAPYYDAWWLEE